jgi:hypothetical protein
MRQAALALILLALAGCGSTPSPPPNGSGLEQLWAAQARALLDGLDEALPRIAVGSAGPVTLSNNSYLYDALLGYTYVDSCGEQLSHLGQPSPRELEVSSLLHQACAHLRHASAQFSRAVKEHRAELLGPAAAEALAQRPRLHHARELLGNVT